MLSNKYDSEKLYCLLFHRKCSGILRKIKKNDSNFTVLMSILKYEPNKENMLEGLRKLNIIISYHRFAGHRINKRRLGDLKCFRICSAN